MGLNFEAKSKNTILVGNISNSVGNPNIHPPLSCKSQLTRFAIFFFLQSCLMSTSLKLLQPDCHMSDSGSYKVGEVCTSGSNLLSTLHKTGSTSIVLVLPRLLIPWTTPTLHISDGCRLPDSGCNQAAHHRQKN